MENPEGEKPQTYGAGKDGPKVPLSSGAQSQSKEDSESRRTPQSERGAIADGAIRRRWKEISDAGVDRQIELFLAFAITFFAAAQWITSCRNNASNSTQTDQIIKAAQSNACAAKQIATASKRNATAAESFATSAGTIKDEISDAEGDFATLANNSADAVKATQAQMRIDQRAWVAALGIAGVPAVDQQFIVKIVAKNTGKTFAKKFQMNTTVQISSPGMGPQFDRKEGSSKTFTSLSLLAPSGEYTSINTITGDGSDPSLPNPTKADMDRFKSGEREVYAFGRMDYFDIFEKPHWTIFCFELNRQLAWIGCDKHNDADND